jgi:hypothetical protein
MIRLHIIAEGRTEEKFIQRMLMPVLSAQQVMTDTRCVTTKQKNHQIFRGGVISYAQVKADLLQWMNQDNHAECRFSTMLDLYALPNDFPGYQNAPKEPYARVAHLEQAFQKDMGDPRFIPYIQLHEFEALLFADASKLALEYAEKRHVRALQNLASMAADQNPELINEGRETAPSKRILREIPEYSKIGGVTVLEQIGLSCLLEKCRHFREWVEGLEGLARAKLCHETQ